MGEEIEALMQQLETMPLEALRAVWAQRFGAAPKLRSPGLLRSMLAWRIQIGAVGGLGPELAEALRLKREPAAAIASGARLAREWKGVRHDVEVTDQGVLYGGQLYDSLSAVARQITGARWNGPRFFGLREGAPL